MRTYEEISRAAPPAKPLKSLKTETPPLGTTPFPKHLISPRNFKFGPHFESAALGPLERHRNSKKSNLRLLAVGRGDHMSVPKERPSGQLSLKPCLPQSADADGF